MWQRNEQMIYGLGPRAVRVFTSLHGRIAAGEWAPGTKLPPHLELASEFGVAPMTIRQVLALLEEQGLVSRQVGRGTFVLEPSGPAVLILGHDQAQGAFLAQYIKRAGHRSVVANGREEAVQILADDPAVVLVLCDLDPPHHEDGVESMQALRAQWPHLFVAVMVTALTELAPLFGTAAWPLHILPKPIVLALLDDVLRLITPRTRPAG
jgi:DNA-binding transcriptional regulator YhcF (GntR family)